ncbi:DUF4382 domain-containing protein [Salinibacter ruber]|uniref:DUF4382 domain-containing protein n=2 Tax=Salinibacter ruber TaxID=146919 RepID=UPI001F07684D|nr:DUF4382 domain-containing protein [Salinibacter ruber]
MKRLSFVTLVALTTFGFLFATGCDSTGSVTDTEDGTLSLSMSDGSTTKSLRTHSGPNSAPDGITEALVTIDAVSVVPVEEEANEGDATEVGVSVLRDANFEVDLKELQTGLDTTLAELELPAGEYGQIRLVTAGMVSVTFQDGTQTDVMIASGQQTGLKVNFDPFTIASADDRVEVTLNWDVKKALKGNPQGQFVITPAIAATVDTSSVGQ